MTATTSPQTPGDDLDDRITTTVRVLMAVNRMTQDDLAREFGVNKSQISRLLKGQRRWQLQDLPTLSRIFDRDPDYFIAPTEGLVRSRWGLPLSALDFVAA